MLQTNQTQKIYYSLRIASAMCFIGHGAFGIITKEIWTNYFSVFGIAHDTAYAMMPYVGSLDVLMGLIILFYPIRVIAGWLVVWGLITAALRPLSGEPFPELIERAGNFGAPLALLLLTYAGNKDFKHWFKPIRIQHINNDEQKLKCVKICLRIVVFLLFVGHGWLNLIEKKGLLDQYRAFGASNPATVAHIIGSLEILGAVSVLIKPVRSVILILFVWKMFSELFYPHWEVFEFVERGGSYGTTLALFFLTGSSWQSLLNITRQKNNEGIVSI